MADAVEFSSLPVVGRKEVQGRLLEALREARSGKGMTLFLKGDPGTGKTHMARSLAAEAGRLGFRTAQGRAFRAEAGVPYALFSETFLPLLREEPPESLNLLTRGGLPELQHLLPGLGPAGERPAPLDSESPEEFRGRVLWIFAELLRGLADREPLLLVMEDLHWADPSSLEMIHYLARQLREHPALLLLTREELPPGESREAEGVERSLLSQDVAESLALPPLSRDEMGVLLGKAFGAGAEAAGAFVDHLHEWTEGNPFFLEETLKSLVASGRLYQKGGTWLGWEIREMELPRTVREATLARLEALPPEARTLVELLTILGGKASYGHLRALSPLPEEEILTTLEMLVAKGLLSEEMDAGTVVYDIRQGVIRESVLAEIGLARSRVLHTRVATTLEEHLGPRAPDFADKLAYHYLQAGREAAGPTAVSYLVLAGRQALAAFGNAEAARYLRAALEILDGEPEGGEAGAGLEGGRTGLLRDLAQALGRLGRYEEALPLWREVVEAEKEAGRPGNAAEARRRMGIIRVAQGDPEGALRDYDSVLSGDLGDVPSATIARTRLRKGIALEAMGHLEDARSELDGAMSLAEEVGDTALLAQAHRALVLLHIWTGDMDRVREHSRRALELARRSGASSVEYWSYVGLAVMEGLLGNTGPMAELVEKAETVATAMRSPILRLSSAELAIEHAAATGEWERGIALGEQAIALARDLSQRTLLPRVLVWTSLIYLGRGEIELARPLLQEAWLVSGAGGDAPINVHGAIPAHIGMGYLALAEQDYDEAIRLGRAGLELAEGVGYSLWAIHRLLPLLAESYLWKGDLEGAREMGERLRQGSEPIGHRLGMAWAETCDALVTWLEGDSAAGAALMEHAANALEEIPMIPDATRLRRQLAGRLAEIGDREGALRELNRVHETFLRLGAEVELEKTRGMFREMEARPPRKVVEGEGELSNREMEIARLVEARKSNKAIARELGISPRTVSTHLSNVYQKLGIGSRGELAGYVRSVGMAGE